MTNAVRVRIITIFPVCGQNTTYCSTIFLFSFVIRCDLLCFARNKKYVGILGRILRMIFDVILTELYIIQKVFIYCDRLFIEYQIHLKCLWEFVPEHLLYQHIKIPTLFIVISFIDININGYSIDICIWHIIHFIGFWQIQLIVCSKNSIVSFILVNIKSKNMLSLYFTSMHFQFNDILLFS